MVTVLGEFYYFDSFPHDAGTSTSVLLKLIPCLVSMDCSAAADCWFSSLVFVFQNSSGDVATLLAGLYHTTGLDLVYTRLLWI
jgi:hypothetical protein